jgi:hypothetical protein
MRSKVVYMAAVKDLLAELEKLRADVLAGDALGWGGTVKFRDREVVYLGGTFKDSLEDQTRAMLKVSAARMLQEDPPLKMRKRAN